MLQITGQTNKFVWKTGKLEKIGVLLANDTSVDQVAINIYEASNLYFWQVLRCPYS